MEDNTQTILNFSIDEFKEKYPSIKLGKTFFEYFGETIIVFEEDVVFDNLFVSNKDANNDMVFSDSKAIVFLKNLTVKGNIYGEADMCSYLHVCGDLEAGTVGRDLAVKVDSNLLVKNFLINNELKGFEVEGKSNVPIQIYEGYLHDDEISKDIIYLIDSEWWEEYFEELVENLLEDILDDKHPYWNREVNIFDVITEYWDKCKEVINSLNMFPNEILEYTLKKHTKGQSNEYSDGIALDYLVNNDSEVIYQKVMEEIKKIRNNQSDFKLLE